ncbi:MAG: hypothetical protein HQL27_06225 [Candidatus Omnitrophica bacterium]|nr:hypothetical protein [Candidatus Omnitrophota bacterium]
MMSKFIKSGSRLNIFAESVRPDGVARPGTRGNDMWFNGDDSSTKNIVSHEPWGSSMDGGTIFTHELGHASSGGNYSSEILNVSNTENLYRAWNGSPARNDYGVLHNPNILDVSTPIPNRSVWQGLAHTY